MAAGNYYILYNGKVTQDTSNHDCINPQYDAYLDTIFTVHPAVGIKAKIENDFTLYPNPTSNTLTIQLPGITTTAQLKLYNTIGEVVLQQTTNQSNTPINISMLPAGIYFVQVETESGSGVKKLVVE